MPPHAFREHLPFHLALRGHTSGVLAIGSRARRARYCVDPERGVPILELDADELALDWLPDPAPGELACSFLIPEEAPGSLQLLGVPDLIDPERSGAGDRYLAYHRRRERAHLAWFVVESAKFGGQVLDAFASPNPLGRAEFAIIRRAHAALEGTLGARLGVGDARVVGVDPLGVDVRGDRGVHRLPFDEPGADEASIERAIARLAGVDA